MLELKEKMHLEFEPGFTALLTSASNIEQSRASTDPFDVVVYIDSYFLVLGRNSR